MTVESCAVCDKNSENICFLPFGIRVVQEEAYFPKFPGGSVKGAVGSDERIVSIHEDLPSTEGLEGSYHTLGEGPPLNQACKNPALKNTVC